MQLSDKNVREPKEEWHLKPYICYIQERTSSPETFESYSKSEYGKFSFYTSGVD